MSVAFAAHKAARRRSSSDSSIPGPSPLESSLKEKCLNDKKFVALYGDVHPSISGEKFIREWRETQWWASNAATWAGVYYKSPYFVLSMMWDEKNEGRKIDSKCIVM
jgi:hypothetical protein